MPSRASWSFLPPPPGRTPVRFEFRLARKRDIDAGGLGPAFGSQGLVAAREHGRGYHDAVSELARIALTLEEVEAMTDEEIEAALADVNDGLPEADSA